jgi:nitrogen fixation NifU-like protein
MTTLLAGKTREGAEALFDTFHRLITSGDGTPPDLDVLGEMAALAGVRKYPNRIKCANLAWHAMRGALRREPRTSTE